MLKPDTHVRSAALESVRDSQLNERKSDFRPPIWPWSSQKNRPVPTLHHIYIHPRDFAAKQDATTQRIAQAHPVGGDDRLIGPVPPDVGREVPFGSRLLNVVLETLQ